MTEEKIDFPPFPTNFVSEFEAVEYLKDWIGIAFWPTAQETLKELRCPACFAEAAEELGVTSRFAQQAWYNLLFGGGEWEKRAAIAFEQHAEQDRRKAEDAKKARRVAGNFAAFLGLPLDQLDTSVEGYEDVRQGWTDYHEAQTKDQPKH